MIAPTSSLRQSMSETRDAIRDLLPITEFTQFHTDPNINFQLNRFLVPGLEQQFAEFGAKIRGFDDWKSQFLKAASFHEHRGDIGPAAKLYRVADFL